LINAVKVSGTEKRLGIGFLNAVTKNICNNRKYSNPRKAERSLEPLTNYNVLVLDQTDKTHL
jgi:hypothetical protein